MNHIFILAMDEFQRQQLDTLKNVDDYCFHNILDIPTLVESEDIDFHTLVHKCRQVILDSGEFVDVILSHWDFPSSLIAPILCEEFGIPYPSLESVLKCEHKYWSRLEQAKVIPDLVPEFCAFDPFDDNALEGIQLEYPFWIKPIKAFSSQLGFLIESPDQFYSAQKTIREKIGRVGKAFNQALERADLPEDVRRVNGFSCLAEEIVSGLQVAPEGSVRNGQVNFHGIFDMHVGGHGKKIDRIEYPSRVADDLEKRMFNACEAFMTHIGFNDGCFNMEFRWDEDKQKLWVIEVNTRISQSHSEMFILVNGVSNHQVAVDVALAKLEGLPENEGPYEVAAKFTISHPHDGVVAGVPSDQDIEALCERFPGTRVKLVVEVGEELNQVPNQDAYSFVLGELYLGAESHDSLLERYQVCLDMLKFDIRSRSHLKTMPEGETDAHSGDLSVQDKSHREPIHPGA